jgi:hypothetical protein
MRSMPAPPRLALVGCCAEAGRWVAEPRDGRRDNMFLFRGIFVFTNCIAMIKREVECGRSSAVREPANSTREELKPRNSEANWVAAR